jgi:hypothetical protein
MGMVKYSLNVTNGKSSMRLFVSAADDVTGTWGEISPQQGGVVIPRLGKVWVDDNGAGPASQECSGVGGSRPRRGLQNVRLALGAQAPRKQQQRSGKLARPTRARHPVAPAGDAQTGTSFGYSSCLKWGYAGSIDVAAFNVAQAADVLGLDLTKVSSSGARDLSWALTWCPPP